MGIISTITDFFRSAPEKSIDRYGLLKPIVQRQEFISKVTELVKLYMADRSAMDLLTGNRKAYSRSEEKAVEAYRIFVRSTSTIVSQNEKNKTFSGIHDALERLSIELGNVEEQFTDLFGHGTHELNTENLRISALVLLGFLEVVGEFGSWVIQLINHIDNDSATPFQTKKMVAMAGEFDDILRITQHTTKSHSAVVDYLHNLQRKGSDVTIRSDNEWLSTFVDDKQFASNELSMINNAMRNPILMIMTGRQNIASFFLEMYEARQEWLTAKIALESNKLRGLDPSSAEYMKMEKVVSKYADLVTQYEQKIERIRDGRSIY